MDSSEMGCLECLQKHLAGALSYAKEVMEGHGEGSALDHRIDLLGEMVNAEHHLELLDGALLMDLRALRRGLQGRGMAPVEGDLLELRRIWSEAGKERRTAPKPLSMKVRDAEGYAVMPKGNAGWLMAQKEGVYSHFKNDCVVLEGSDTQEGSEARKTGSQAIARLYAIPVNPIDLNLVPSVKGVFEVEGEEAKADATGVCVSWQGRLCCRSLALARRVPFAMPLDGEAFESLQEWLTVRRK